MAPVVRTTHGRVETTERTAMAEPAGTCGAGEPVPSPVIPLAGPVDPQRLLADRIEGWLDRLLPGLGHQTDAPARDAYLGVLVGMSATVEALRDPVSPDLAEYLELAVRMLEGVPDPSASA
jgi:hypothetical protein